ncbi:MAG TPA: PBP1A family penicillin-binding protein [Vicinamibacterales bacterium]|nr:PBP1A family penicillin-binding protein [Vicinamibacterales bacterium]
MRPVRKFRVLLARPKPGWFRIGVMVVGVGLLAVVVTLGFFWVRYGRIIDARFGSEQRTAPRIFGRPFELEAGRGLTPGQLVQRLNDIGYAERQKVTQPGEFSVAGLSVMLMTRPEAPSKPHTYRVDFSKSGAPSSRASRPDSSSVVSKILADGGAAVKSITLEAPMLAALAPGEKRRLVPLASIPRHVVDAILTIEDRRFYEHPGIDPVRMFGALVTNLRGDRPYLEGASTITQQIIKNFFLTPDKSYTRKVQEQFMAVVLESRFNKDQILELYLNDVVLGQRGPFEIHGVAEAARIFFGKDIRNVTLAESATMAGLIQSPSVLSPFRNPDRARERRNVVLKEMADVEVITREEAVRTSKEPLRVATRALENEAPYFVDFVSKQVSENFSGLLKRDRAVDVYTTLDLHLQRFAQEAVDEGIAQVDKVLAKRKKGQAQVALVAVDPTTGEILALVGGRAYNQSQFNRAVAAQRQPGSAFKPFVYLAAFEQTAAGTTHLTPATIVADEPTTFVFGEKPYDPANYQGEYDGPITLRRALALSRNVVAIKVAETAGYENVAGLWRRVGVGTPAQPYPSIALGVFEVSPLELTQAYTIFTNGGSIRPLQAITRIVDNGNETAVPPPPLRPVTRPDVTYLVTNMMRSVINEGTAASVRSSFSNDAAGKTGTTNDLRDAWFMGFTPTLLTAVWVGFDDNQPIGLSGSQAALPIWTGFMRRALAGRPNKSFAAPPGVMFVDIDRSSGKIANFNCPSVMREAFLPGSEPTEICDIHGNGLFSRLGGFFRRIIRQ